MSTQYDLDLAECKKCADDRLISKLLKADYDASNIDSLSRDELFGECMVLKGHDTSKFTIPATKLPATAPTSTDRMTLLQIFMQQQQIQMQRHDEQQQLFLAALAQQKVESEANVKVSAESLKASFNDAAVCNEQIQKDRQVEISKQEVKEKTQEILFKRYSDLLKSTLSNQPDNDFDLPVYLNSIKTIFKLHNVLLDLRETLLIPYLNSKTKTLICRLTPDQIKTYEGLKTTLLREFRFTPHQYRVQFNRAFKRIAESYVQFNTRLITMFKYYINSRNVKDFDSLVNLIITDRLKDSSPDNVHNFVVTKKPTKSFHQLK